MVFLACKTIMVNLLLICKSLQDTEAYSLSVELENHLKGEIT